LFDLGRLERLVVKHVTGDFFALNSGQEKSPTGTDTPLSSGEDPDTNTNDPEDLALDARVLPLRSSADGQSRADPHARRP
jgi:hypothetical protein